MAVLLTVLKIIGIILLSLLGLVLFLLVIVLFAPIGYDVEGIYDDDNRPLVNVHAHWLLRIIRYRFTLKGKEKEQELKLLFFTLMPKKEKEEKPKKTKKKKKKKPAEKNRKDRSEKEKTKDGIALEAETAETVSTGDNEEAFARLEQKLSEDIPETDEEKAPEKERVSIFKKISDACDKIKYKFTDICDKIKDGRMKAEDLISKYSDERTKNAVIELWIVLKRLLWHIRPRRFKAYLHYGMEDPSQTGEIFGIYNSFYPIHRGKPVVIPDFDNKCLDGNMTIRGHIQLFFVVTALIRLYFNKDVRRLYDMIK